MKIKVTSQALDAIQVAALEAAPREACGLLTGRLEAGEVWVMSALATRNIHPTPETHFEVEPQALINAFREEREGGPALLGYFHSHPVGEAVPSATDQAISPGDGRVWAIVAAGEVRFWRDDPAGFTPLDHVVTDPAVPC